MKDFRSRHLINLSKIQPESKPSWLIGCSDRDLLNENDRYRTESLAWERSRRDDSALQPILGDLAEDTRILAVGTYKGTDDRFVRPIHNHRHLPRFVARVVELDVYPFVTTVTTDGLNLETLWQVA